MTFARKVFAAIFISTLIVGTLLIWVSYSFFEKRAEEDFRNRYGSLTRILSDALTRLDVSTETLMKNAAIIIADADRDGVPSTESLRSLRDKSGVTHAFIIDSTGKFVRSSNEPVERIPNLFSFSPDYKRLLNGETLTESTPIILPKPEFAPYKFLSIPSYDHKRIIEVGVRVDFITKTLAEAVRGDSDVKKMTLYNPSGTQLGVFSDFGATFGRDQAKLPTDFDYPIIDGEYAHFFARVSSSHERCSQCDVAGVSVNGQYYYVLESTVSTRALVSARSLAMKVALVFLMLNAAISYVAATLIARRLVRNIKFAVSKVRQIGEDKSSSARVGLNDGTEISYLTNEFDRMLDVLETSQQQVLAANAVQSRVEIARVVAHNIRSPLLALEMMLPTLPPMPDRSLKVLRSSISEIKQLSLQLQDHADGRAASTLFDLERFSLRDLIKDVVAQKEFENAKPGSVVVEIENLESSPCWVRANRNQLRGVLSNLINNAFESMNDRIGKVRLRLNKLDNKLIVGIEDDGPGISESILSELGERAVSTKEGADRGIGVMHAKSAVESFGGSITFKSVAGRGTTVRLTLPIDGITA